MAKAKETTAFPTETTSFPKAYYKHDVVKKSDLYKLMLNFFKKNLSLPGEPPRFDDTEHSHYFRTISSDGKSGIYSTQTGGHFHEVEVIKNPDPNGLLLVKCKSGPLKWVKYKDEYGKYQRKIAAFERADNHTHEVEYFGRSDIQPRAINPEAVKTQSIIEKPIEVPAEVIL